ncbi:sugar phosphate isomerase/epimerase family protein [Streptomyces hainanensis]|uniref:Xylose isomerase n=1 Tax=Streptomyces hainanensis TaxID=402648 RepID=A0A4R4TUW7_9ACTN|nr:sugar phosphate isomerase/epimerase [Streptomyces hainanensis]TDC79824.1 xylose isomerase [Streptomyces hainanensis]
MSGPSSRSLPASRVALNPIHWMATDDGWLDPSSAPERGKLLSLVRQAGFGSVMLEVPVDWSVERYRDAVGETGLSLAPGYFVCRSDGRDGTEAEVLESAAKAARIHAELGLTDVGLGMGMKKGAPRVLRPAQGHESDAGRLAAVTELVRRISEVMRAEGVRPALHPHVGTWIETEDEARAVLGALGPEELGFLPDTGHLAWAGGDVRALVADHAERVPFVHVKDCRLSVAERGRAEGWDYQRTVVEGLWAEPGRGELPLADILGALPGDFAGWLMVEVDRPAIADPLECAIASAEWMNARYGGGATA